jgi:hypothetical protein
VKKYFLPAVFSLIYPGLGDLYVSRYLEGFFYILVGLGLDFLLFPFAASRGAGFYIQGAVVLYRLGVLGELLWYIHKEKEVKRRVWTVVPFALTVGLLFLYSRVSSSPVKGILGNLHTHTTCSDGISDYESIIQEALKLNFQFIAITDHTYGEVGPCLQSGGKCDFRICDEVLEKCRRETRLLCLPSQEVTSQVHILAIGINKAIGGEWPRAEQIKEIHRQGGLAILAHPYNGPEVLSEAEIAALGFDAIECLPANNQEGKVWREMAQRLNLPCVYGSDAHYAGILKVAYNNCQGPVNSLADLKNLIKQNQCSLGSSYPDIVLRFIRWTNKPKN